MGDSDKKVDSSYLSEIVGVYHAKGTFFGEVAYMVKKLVAGRSCSLCNISHAGLGEKSEFDRYLACIRFSQVVAR